MLFVLAHLLSSEEDEPMDEDGKTNGKEDSDDLAKYNLDDYDKESKSIGPLRSCLAALLVSDWRTSSCRSVQGYEVFNILQKQ